MIFSDSKLVKYWVDSVENLGFSLIYTTRYHPDPPLPHSQYLFWRNDQLYLVLQQQVPDKQRFVECLKVLFDKAPFPFKYIKEDFAVVNDWGETLVDGSDNELLIHLTTIYNTIHGPRCRSKVDLPF